MYVYNAVLRDSIISEINDKDYSDKDAVILSQMCDQMRKASSYNFRYLTEIDQLDTSGLGDIMKEYVCKFETQYIKAVLLFKMACDKTKGCDELAIELYSQFKASDNYIQKPNAPAPCGIYVRYDNVFNKLKPKRFKRELIELAKNPLDVVYLPFTMRMLASWKIPEIKDIFVSYSKGTGITKEVFGIKDNEADQERFYYRKREMVFAVIGVLKYYPIDECIAIIEKYSTSDDKDIASAAQNALKKMLK